MKIYTVIGGVNGTGKSSLTGVLKTQTTDLGIIIDVDKITPSTAAAPYRAVRSRWNGSKNA